MRKLRGFCAFGGTWSAFGGGWARSVVASCRSVVILGGSVVGCGHSVVILLFRFSGNSVAFRVLSGLLFLHLFTYSVRLVGCFRLCSIGRSGGLPTEGLRGHPLTIPFLAEYQGFYIFTP